MKARSFHSRDDACRYADKLSASGWRIVTIIPTDEGTWIVTASMDVPNALREAVSTVAGGLALAAFFAALFITAWTALPGGMVPA